MARERVRLVNSLSVRLGVRDGSVAGCFGVDSRG